MKILIALLTLTFVSANAFAGVVNLKVGESITLSANSQTTVTCGGEGNLCATPIKNLKSKFDFCKAQPNAYVEDCINDLWPKFKKGNSQCVEDAYQTCLTFCKSDTFGLDCLNLCQ